MNHAIVWRAALFIGSLAAAQSAIADSARIRQDFAQLPLYFEENRGQSDSRARYIGRASNHVALIASDGLTLASGREAVSIRFAGANSKARAAAANPVDGVTNYYLAGRAITGVPHYGRVRVNDVLHGVDVVYYGAGRDLEYDLVIHPAADPGAIRLRVEGAGRAVIDAAGDLVVKTAAGELRQRKPNVWQQTRGRRVPVDSHYAMERSGEIRLILGAYRRSARLIVDPVLSFCTYYADSVAGIAADGAGNVYVVGDGAGFPVTNGPNPGENLIVTKLNPLGTALVYSTYIVPAGRASAIAADASGNAFVHGISQAGNAFVTKLGPDGQLVYSTMLGGIYAAAGIAVDQSGAAYVTGTTSDPHFPVTPTGLPASPTPFFFHAYAVKLTPGGQIDYSVTFGGSGTDHANGIAVDAAGDAFISGDTTSNDFPVTPGAFATTLKGIDNGFVAVLNPAASNFIYATYLGGSKFDQANGIAVDKLGNAYVAGNTVSPDLPVVGGFVKALPTNGSNTGAFIAKLNPTGTALLYSSYLPGSFLEYAGGIAVDSDMSAYVAGTTFSADFPTSPGALKAPPPPQIPYNVVFMFFMKIAPDGGSIAYSTLLGGSAYRYANYGGPIAIDSKGGVYLGGSTASYKLPVTPGAILPAFGNGIIAKIDMNSPTLCNASVSPSQATVPSRGGTFSYLLTLPPGCPWEALSDPQITINPPRGMGASTPILLTGTIAPSDPWHPLATPVIVTGNATFTVQTSPPCQDAIVAPQSLTIDAAGGVAGINVTSPQACSWNASAPDPWVTISPNGAFAGSRTFSLNVLPNPYPTQRQTKLTIARVTVTVTQTPGAGCVLTLSSPNTNFPGQGGTGVVRVATQFNGCVWTAASGAPWIRLQGPGSGEGAAILPFIVSPNPGLAPRSAKIAVGRQSITVAQTAGPANGVGAAYTSTLFAGGGPVGTPLGDEGPAVSAGIVSPRGLAFDPGTQTLYIADSILGRVRSVTPDGVIHTVAGGGTSMAEGISPGSAALSRPIAVAVDSARAAIYVTDATRIRSIANGLINTVAGSSIAGSTGDNGPALNARLSNPSGLVVDPNGNLYISDSANNRVREVSAGAIANFAGGGGGALGDAGPAGSATLSYPVGLAADASHIYVADQNQGRIRAIAQGVITTVAGGGNGGDGGLATSASLPDPAAVAVDPAGNLFIADGAAHSVRKVALDGTISTISPPGVFYSIPAGLAADPSGNVYVSDAAANAVYVLTPTAPLCNYTVSSPPVQPMAGGPLTLTVTTGANCNWSASSDLTWAAISSGTSGTGSGTVSLNISPSITGGRAGAIVVAGQAVLIAQGTGRNTRDIRGAGVSDLVIYNPANGQEYTGLSNGDGTFNFVPNLFTSNFDTLRFCDFNGDGKADLVLYNSATALAYIGAGDGAGRFAFQSLFWSAGYDRVVAGDLNGDGRSDFVLYRSSDGTLYTALSNADGTFTYKYTLVSVGYSIAIADFNGDGKADVFLYRLSDGLANLGLSDGNGGFSFTPLFVSPGYDAVQTGDLDGDAKADLLLYSSATGAAATGLSNGAGFVFTPQTWSPGFTTVRLFDFNGDGKADAALYNRNTSVGYIGAGNGTGSFAFVSLFWGPGYDNVDTLDLNGDGKMDVILYNSQNAASYTGISTGNPASPFTYQYSYWGPNRSFAK